METHSILFPSFAVNEACGIYDTSFLSFMKRGVREGRPRILRSVFRPRSTTYSGLCADTTRLVLSLSIGFGARVLVARSIFTVGAKRCRRTDVLIRTQISIRLRILTQLAPNVTVGAKRFRYTEVSFQPGYRCNMKCVVYTRKELCDHRLCPRTYRLYRC